MKKIKSNKVPSGHNLSKVSGMALLSLIMLVSGVEAEPLSSKGEPFLNVAAPFSNITFVTTGSSFSPIITVTGNPTIQWIFGDGSTSNSASPTVNFGSAGTRTNTLVVTPWSAVTKINIGYDGSDDGVTPGPDTIANLRQQNVINVTGLENVAPYLQVWASSLNPITALDFSNFTVLHTIECFYCRSLTTIKLRNVPSLTRLCLENCNISYLDISEAPSLADIRVSSQRSSTYTINWGTTGANLWHICIRDNPQMKSTFPLNQFPLLRDYYNWNDNQSGTLHLTSTSLKTVLSSNNHYNAANFSGCFPAGRNCEVKIQNNNLKCLDISNDPGLLSLNASLNLLNQTAVDGILQTLDFYNTSDGYLDLIGNAAPSIIGLAHVNNLTTRNWEVKIPSQNNPPIANFTSNTTSGTVPLAVQFNGTSLGNPITWSWDFGDGTYSIEKFPNHVYTSPGNYTVTLAVRNSNSADFKDATITVLKEDSSSDDSSSDDISGNDISGNDSSSGGSSDSSDSSDSGRSHSSSGNGAGGGAGGSPEPQSNVEIKELSQTFVASGKSVKFEFPKSATSIVYVSFDSKKTAGKTTTIAEMLKEKSTLVIGLPSDEVYKYLNIWVGNSGFATSKNIENAVVSFKVEKAWLQDKKIDKASITLNRYSDKKWTQLPAIFSGEDNSYLYFTARTLGYSSFAITGKTTVTGTGIQPAAEKKTPLAVNDTQNKSDGSTVANIDQTAEKKDNTNTPAKESKSTPGFEIMCGMTAMLAVYLYRRK